MIIGTCSICGGRVEVPDVWYGLNPPTPTCQSCGAIAANNGPVIQMQPTTPAKFGYSTTNAIKEIDHA